jgi:hypothetical protein
MKSKIFSILILSLAFVMITVVSCDKGIDSTEQLQPLMPASLDENAGDWSMVLLTSPTQFSIAVPTDVTSDAYKAELASIKDLQSKLTPGRKKSIAYWSGGGVLRWNQIFRELVARYNLPPEPVNGSYPAPDSENPFSFPQFPFSNPPYAARAYSYVTAVQYDALKAAWHYKYQYNRPAPSKVDTGIKALMPESDLPAYPSEAAVMSGAAAEMLKLLFPAAVEEITKKAAEQRNAALWSGKATASDISEGLALGKAVAGVFITRAKGDLMSKAVGDKTKWKALEDNATVRGDIPWHSLESPARPPMLPFFNNVTPWIITYNDILSVRPGPPPLAGDTEMDGEVKEVKKFADNLTRTRHGIVLKWADGVGTYTPPGHWNDIAEEYIRDAKYSEVRAARAFALLNMTMHNAAIACWDTKFFYFNARPTQLDPSIKTGTGIPNFPSYVSGHSTFSASAATFLSYLFPMHAADFDAMANEAAMSRLYAGIHYRKDCMVGLDLGNDIGDFTVTYAQQDGADE